MSGESRRKQEVPGSLSSADQGIVIGCVLAETGPAPSSFRPTRDGATTAAALSNAASHSGELRPKPGLWPASEIPSSRPSPALWKYKVLPRSRVNGTVGMGCISGAVKPICRRTGTTATRPQPSHRCAATTPAADHSVGPHHAPTRADRRHLVVVGVDRSDVCLFAEDDPEAASRVGIAVDDLPRLGVAVPRRERGAVEN